MKLFFLLLLLFSSSASICLAEEGSSFFKSSLDFLKEKKSPDIEILAEIQKGKLILSGNVKNGAYIYSFLGTQKEPIPTKIYLAGQKIPKASIQESKAVMVLDEAYMMQLYIHKQAFQVSIQLPQKLQKKAKGGYLLYQICDSLVCSLPKKIPFQIQ